MAEGLTGSPEPEKTHLPRRAVENPDLTKEVSDRRRIAYLQSQIGFLKESPEDSPWAKQAKQQMRQRLSTISGAFDVTTDPDERQALNDLAGDIGTAGNDLFLTTRGNALPANLDTLLVTNPKASEKAVLHLPATEEFFVTAMSEREARIKAGGSVLLVGGKSGTEKQSMGRYLKTSEIQKPEEMVASDYKALCDLRNWATSIVEEQGSPTNKSQAEWTDEDRRLQSKLDTIQGCEAYFAQSYGGDIAHNTAPTEIELNVFHQYLGKLRDNVLSGVEADDTETIEVVPEDRSSSFAERLGVVAAQGVKLAEKAAGVVVRAGAAAFEARIDDPVDVETERKETEGIELPLSPDLVDMFRTGEVFGEPLSAQEMFSQLVSDIFEGSSLPLTDLPASQVYPLIVEELEWRRGLLVSSGITRAAEEMEVVLGVLKNQYETGALGVDSGLELVA